MEANGLHHQILAQTLCFGLGRRRRWGGRFGVGGRVGNAKGRMSLEQVVTARCGGGLGGFEKWSLYLHLITEII